jgi:HEAT repeat protein
VIVAGVAFLAGAACSPAHDASTLFAELQHPDPEVRLDARQKIDRIISAGDYKVFVRGLESPDDLHKVQSILYLADMPQEGARRALRGLLSVKRRMMLPFNPIRLKPSLEDHDSRILIAHLVAVRGGDPEALPVLLDGLDPSDRADIVTGSCFAIGALADPGGIPFLSAVLRSPDLEVVRAAVQALGQFREPTSIEALSAVVSHPSVEVRADILSSLDVRETPGSIDLVLKIARSDPSEDLRTSAIRRLEMGPDSVVTPALIELLRDPSAIIRATAASSLTRRSGRNFGEDADRWSRWWDEQTSREGSGGRG